MEADTIILHATGSADLDSALKKYVDPSSKEAPHLLVDIDGSVIQFVPFNVVAWHAGKSRFRQRSGLNQYAIGIELVNSLGLERSGDTYIAATGETYDGSAVVEAEHPNASAFPDNDSAQRNYWHRYTEEQVETVREIGMLLVETYGITTILGHEEVSPDRVADPGPAFPLGELRGELAPQMGEVPPGEVPPAEERVQSKAAGTAVQSDGRHAAAAARPNAYARFLIEKTLHSDSWAEEDLLGYELYASAIKQMIVSPGRRTRPPLTIAVLAPWGQGKTTLMRYIERAFAEVRQNGRTERTGDAGAGSKWNATGAVDPAAAASAASGSTPGSERSEPATRRRSRSRRKRRDQSPNRRLKVRDLLDLGRVELGLRPVAYPTVWFNPWKYQSSEQIWAGMAHAVVGQLVEYLSPADRERFWFKLNLRRVDVGKIRSTVHRRIISLFVSDLSLGIVLLSVALLLIPIFAAAYLVHAGRLDPTFVRTAAGLLSFLGVSGPSVAKYLSNKHKLLSESLGDELGGIVREPDYEKKLGFFHEVERDVREVFDLIVDESAPAVIFIDDLDRCSPDKVVEVIEAMNLMINSDFSAKCYFIIGMDGQMVAASLDERYQSLVDKFREEEKKYGSIGWYFLDKFIQLPIFLPILSPEKKEDLLDRLFVQGRSRPGEPPVEKSDEATIDAYLRDKQDEEKKAQVRRLFTVKPDLRQRFVERNIEETREDSPEIVSQLTTFSPYLGTSPRSIKRFVNMFRFYYSYQELRSVEGHEFAAPDSLAKWLVLSLRYPQLVRFIQWEREDAILHSKVPEEKARRLDQLFGEFGESRHLHRPATLERTVISQWYDHVDKMNLVGFDWLKEDDLLRLALLFDTEESRLEQAIRCNVW